MLPVVFSHSVIVSRSLHHTKLHYTKHFTSLFRRSFSKGPQKMVLSLIEASFCHCYPLLNFLTTIHVATDITPQVFEAVHLFNGFTFNPYTVSIFFGFLPITIAVVVPRSLHLTILHVTQNTSLVSSVVLFPRARRKCFFFC